MFKLINFKNRYVIATVIFLVYLLIFDQYNFIAQYRLSSELSKLEKDKEYYQQELEKDSITYHSLFNSPDNIEKFAREHYMMKKDNEDIYLLIGD
jgi:cell division protein FtsB